MDAVSSRVTPDSDQSNRSGLVYGVAAYGFWGLVPIYFKAVAEVSALEVLAHRVVWSVMVLGVVLTIQGRWREVRDAIGDRRTLPVLLLTALLVGTNWYVFIWAVATGKVLQASLAYFINPLVNVVLGVVFLRERLSRGGVVAVALATIAVIWLTVQTGSLPWASLVMACTFGLYGLLRKTASVKPVPGLMVETALMLPASIVLLAVVSSRGGLYFGTGSLGLDALLVAAGLVTALPLLWFTAAARLLPLSTLGFLQYIAPTGHFLLAVLAYGEPLTAARLLAFVLIWIALGIFTVDQVRGSRRESEVRGRMFKV